MSASAASAISGFITDSTSQTGVYSTQHSRLKRMRYNVVSSSNMLDAHSRRGGFRFDPVMVTLTYRTVDQPQPRDIAKYLDTARQWFKRRALTFRYAWVAELQKRGALHYHVVIWMPHGYRLPKPDQWYPKTVGPKGQGDAGPHPHYRWWPHGWSRIEKARNAVGYVAKYASKLNSKADLEGAEIPKGFRIYGIGGLSAEHQQQRRWCNLPGWLRDRVTTDARCKRIIGGGWIDKDTLDFWPSPFKLGRVTTVGGRTFITLRPALPEGAELCSPLASLR